MQRFQRYWPVVLLALALFFIWKQHSSTGSDGSGPSVRHVTMPAPVGAGGDFPVAANGARLSRKSLLTYTRHARCRMDCREITKEEIEAILVNGKMNEEKSDLADKPCPTYALEGYAADGQHLRVVFAVCGHETKVVTCIDLERDWSCDCK
ncbi:DUF4258 domain-containing protein [Chitinophaga pendula]|uniref:DUF4258 domain-containing protein n=1 Tax=Chitinophaga TaxID=79328 RepID=UPI0012FD9C01|nr:MULTISPECIES: DUF4258 domain-containing protein [Chitinophaga]UCJ07960.1 DUF4258 domain-containing protein [Chitinophaga pendula]